MFDYQQLLQNEETLDPQDWAAMRQLAHQMVEQEPLLELLAPVTMNIVCFRYVPENAEHLDLNALNKEILMRLHEEGVAAPSYTILHGQYAIRVCIANHRTRKEDLEALVEGVVRIGREVN